MVYRALCIAQIRRTPRMGGARATPDPTGSVDLKKINK